MTAHSACISWLPMWSFRPLSWGLSFNMARKNLIVTRSSMFSSPFLGTFFQSRSSISLECTLTGFRPLSWGLSFNIKEIKAIRSKANVFVPFLGDFLSINGVEMDVNSMSSFRPLSWGLSFNKRYQSEMIHAIH